MLGSDGSRALWHHLLVSAGMQDADTGAGHGEEV